jgi:hypothetical protein
VTSDNDGGVIWRISRREERGERREERAGEAKKKM